MQPYVQRLAHTPKTQHLCTQHNTERDLKILNQVCLCYQSGIVMSVHDSTAGSHHHLPFFMHVHMNTRQNNLMSGPLNMT